MSDKLQGLTECTICHAAVFDTEKHEAWHGDEARRANRAVEEQTRYKNLGGY